MPQLTRENKAREDNVLKRIELSDDSTSIDVLEKLRQASRVETTEIIEAPEDAIYISGDGLKKASPCTMGNFSAATGKAKSRKSFLVCAIMACVLSRNVILKFKTNIPYDRSKGLYIDTEQGKHHVKKCKYRIFKLTELEKETFDSKLEFLSLRKFNPKERFEIIEHTIRNSPGLGFVVIDGIRDCVFDINSPEEAVKATSKLLKLTEEYNIHILVVLHQNKGNNESRGHLGTEINNKAESVINVNKDPKNKSISIVESEFARDIDFEPFAFSINDEELPYLLDSIPAPPAPAKKFDPISMQHETHKAVLGEVFKDNSAIMYGEIVSRIKIAFDKLNTPIGTNKAGELKVYYEMEKYIIKGADKKYRRNET